MRRVGFENTRGRGIRAKLCGSLRRRLHRTDRWHCSPFFCTRQRSGGRTGAAGNNIPPNGEISPTGEYKEGVAVGPWMLYPSIFVGGVYNSNFNQAATAANTRFWLEFARGSAPDRDRH